MAILIYTAQELYNWLIERRPFTLLDVRNDKDFRRFQVESPYPFTMQNISYYDFMELEEESVARLDTSLPVRVVCAKEGSARFVAEILERHGFADVGILEGGIKSWGNLLVPQLVTRNPQYTLYQFIRPGKGSCSYGLVAGQQMMLFDPSRNIDFYLGFAAAQGCTISHTCETHLQADYIAGSRQIMEATGAILLANAADFAQAQFPYTPLQDGQQIALGKTGPTVRCLYTPGHTPGSTSFIIDERYLLTGDTVFLQSVGRPDLGGMVDEWAETLYQTLMMMKTLDQNLLVLPGHYISWQEAGPDLLFAAPLAEAIAHNNHIYQLASGADFLEFIKRNMREQPKEYATIRRVNSYQEQVDDEQAEVLDLGKNECAASAYAAAQAATA